jgi:hypothetical protein
LAAASAANAQAQEIIVTPPVGAAGAIVTIVGRGYTAGAHLGQVLWDDVAVGTIMIDPNANGGFGPIDFQIPVASNAGNHEITVCDANPCGNSSFATAGFDVTASNAIRVCLETADPCGLFDPETEVTVHRIGYSKTFAIKSNLVQERDNIEIGDSLWVTYNVDEQRRFTVYYTSGDGAPVVDSAFDPIPGGPAVMTIVVTEDKPLMVHNLLVSAQWTLTSVERRIIASRLHRASDFLYDFTDGQFVFGDITFYQDYEQWNSVDLWLYANNNLRPKASAGGIVTANWQDPDHEKLVYYPGHIHMGSAWNRYNRPPNETILIDGEEVDPATLVDDWSHTLAHEVGHYIFFLFDTYFGFGPNQTIANVYSCTGSAMSWVYEAENWGFIYDPTHWNQDCKSTHAFSLVEREEWATMTLHYPWLIRPTNFVVGPPAPPVELTNVNFVGVPSASNIPTMTLQYDAGETAGRRAKGYLLHNDRVIGLGNAPLGATQFHLTGAQLGDQFCVYDIDNAPPEPHTPRFQYGCETLETGDTVLDMERDTSWAPIVLLTPVSETSVAISLTAPLGGAPVAATLYPEHKTGSTSIDLSLSGPTYSGVFSLTESTPSAFVKVYVDEASSEADPRREAMALYGVDGGTVPGPSRCNEKAPVYSSDGQSQAWPVEPIELQEGEWVSIQYMVAAYPTPPGTTQVSDAYRLISWPPSLADSFVVTVVFSGAPGLVQAASAENAAEDLAVIYYWTGTNWTPAPTSLIHTPHGGYAASAIVPNGSIYTLLSTLNAREIFLPSVVR